MARSIQSLGVSGVVIRYEGIISNDQEFMSFKSTNVRGGDPFFLYELTVYSNNTLQLSTGASLGMNTLDVDLMTYVFGLRDTSSNIMVKNISLPASSSILLNFQRLCAGLHMDELEVETTSKWSVLHADPATRTPLTSTSTYEALALPDLGFDFFFMGLNVRSNITVQSDNMTLFFGRPRCDAADLSGCSNVRPRPPALYVSEVREESVSLNRSWSAHVIVGRHTRVGGVKAYVVRYEMLDVHAPKPPGALAAVVEYTILEDNTITIAVGKTMERHFSTMFALNNGSGQTNETISHITLEPLTTRKIALNKACGCAAGVQRDYTADQNVEILLQTEDSSGWDVLEVDTETETESAEARAAVEEQDLNVSYTRVLMTSASGSQDWNNLDVDDAAESNAPQNDDTGAGNHTLGVCKQGLPGALGLYAACDAACCLELFSLTHGFWDMHFEAMQGNASSWRVQKFSESGKHNYTVNCGEAGGCSVHRRRSDCGEEYDTFVSPAAVKDQMQTAGAALLLGPPCKVGRQEDWSIEPVPNASDTHATPPSLLTFLTRASAEEALQFDGTLNSGLYITDDISSLDQRAHPPRPEISIEIWFTIENDAEVPYAALAAANMALPDCQTGWSLGYSAASPSSSSSSTSSTQPQDLNTKITLFFTAAVEANSKLTDSSSSSSSSSKKTARTSEVLHTQIVQGGTWIHVVATYDGRTLSLYLNGALAQSTPACSFENAG
jgi:hypothetical protein